MPVKNLWWIHIPDEIFAIFLLIVILALANDKAIVEKVNNNISIQIGLVIIAIYCVYNKVPFSLGFMILFVFGVVFGNFLEDSAKTIDELKSKEIPPLSKLGAKVLSLLAKDKQQPQSHPLPEQPDSPGKSCLKKTRFEDDDKCDNTQCEDVEKFLKLVDDPDPESECETNYDSDEEEEKENDLVNYIKTKTD